MGAGRPEGPTANRKEGIGDALGWFPFPGVDGGAGLPTDVFGGADGFAVGRDAPPEAVDFLEVLRSADDVAKRWAELNDGIPAADERRRGGRHRPEPARTVLAEARPTATFAQLYLDQATTPGPGRRHQRRHPGALRRHV